MALGFFLLGLVLVWLWPRAARWGLLPALPGFNQTPAKKEPTFAQATVVSWQPETATLVYTDAKGIEQQLVIKPLRPMVIVPFFTDGKLTREEPAMTSKSPNWKTAFCPEDKLQLKYDETGQLATVRNQGPRSCK